MRSIGWAACFAAVAAAAALMIQGCAKPNALTIYTSVDQDYSQPIIQAFIDANPEMQVNVFYDMETNKTTGVYQRIRQEKRSPQADVFWNSEIIRTIQLKQQDLLAAYHSPSAQDIPTQYKDPDGFWTGFSARARVMLINRDIVPDSETPNALPDLANPKYSGKRGMAVPAFGTTSTHMAALFTRMPENQFLVQMMAMKTFGRMELRPSNSAIRDDVADGRMAFGVTDTDDSFAAIDAGKPVEMVYLDQDGIGTLVIPNTVALIKDSPNPENGKAFIDYLLSPEIELELAKTRARQIPLRDSVARPEGVPDLSKIKAMDVDYEKAAGVIDQCIELLRDKGFF